MNFIAPEFLYFLGFLAIPILIHLFNFRRYKTVKFSQVRFLRTIKKQTQSTSRLKHLIVLLCRCLAIAALVFAFAQPYLIEDENKSIVGKKGIIIYLDNSFSMEANTEVGNLLDAAKNKAISIIDAFSEADKFQLHTNEFAGKQERWLNKEAFINELQNISFSPIFRSSNDVISRLNQIKNKDDYIISRYLISDLQQVNFNFESISDSSLYHILPIQSSVSINSWISNVNSFQPFHLAKQAEKLDVTINTSNSEEAISFNGALKINGKLKSPFTIKIENDSIIESINYSNPKSSQVVGNITIKDYPVTFDDTFYYSYPMQAPIKVLHIYETEASNSLKTLYEFDSLINYQSNSIKQTDFSVLGTSSLVILDGLNSLSTGAKSELEKYVKSGGSLSIFPSAEMDVNAINSLLNSAGAGYYQSYLEDTTDVVQLNSEAKLFDNVFDKAPKQILLPKVNSYWRINSAQNVLSQAILSFRNNDAFLVNYTVNDGSIYLCSSSLNEDQGNFSKHALFVPLLFNMALQSINPKPLAFYLGESSIYLNKIEQKSKPVRLVRNEKEIIPKQSYQNNVLELSIGNNVTNAGHYELWQGDEFLQTISFNYNRKESNLDVYSIEEFMNKAKLSLFNVEVIEAEAEVLSKIIKDNNQGKKLWKQFILLTLLFIGLEILFLRILK